jgi:GNAT superfamily N-acetyltransferase
MAQSYARPGLRTGGFRTAGGGFAPGSPAQHDVCVPSDVIQRRHGRYTLSTDRALVDVEAVHRFLSESSYWARGRPFDVQASAIANSPLVVGAYHDLGADEGGAQVGFARMVTDLATFSWLADVYVLEEHRGGGLGTAMVRLIVEHPEVSGVPLQVLATLDAHGLYARFGYAPVAEPARWMVRNPSNSPPADSDADG